MAATDKHLEEFTRYYEDTKKHIFNYILYRVGFDRMIAEDLTSEIFIKAFEHFASYDRKRSFKTWVFTIAHNHLVNYYSSKRETIPLDEAIEIVKKTHYSEEVDMKAEVSRVLQLVDQLPANQRELVIMRYVNDLSYKEISDVTNKEEGAVRTALSRATTILRSRYSSIHCEK